MRWHLQPIYVGSLHVSVGCAKVAALAANGMNSEISRGLKKAIFNDHFQSHYGILIKVGFFAQPLKVDDLAAHVHMSPSTFRQHFRGITGTSPLQYQKQLRLQEARQLMLIQAMDAGRASITVGYESPSQFSREYSRLFGAPPQQDLKRLREARA